MPSPYSEHGFDPTLGGRLPALSFEAPLHDERWRRLLINSADLPVAWRTNDIYLGIENHDVTFISAPVGSGKSTFIPTMVALTGDNRVLCCEPRRDLTEDLGLRTSHILGESLGQTVAFRHAERKRGGGNAKLLYCTAGLALEREFRQQNDDFEVVVLDDAHTRSLNLDTLLALYKRLLLDGENIKLVIMSGTLQHESLMHFYEKDGLSVTHIDISGSMFPVESREPGESMEHDLVLAIDEGFDVALGIYPGRHALLRGVNRVRELGVDVPILPLYSELSHAERRGAIESTQRRVICATSGLAEDGRTFVGRVAVVDSGLVRYDAVRHGVEVRLTEAASKASAVQRAGKAGRTAPGAHFDHCPVPDAERRDNPVPEIQCTFLDRTFLKLAKNGIYMPHLDFYNQPDQTALDEAESTLRRVHCLKGRLEVTRKGERALELPLRVPTACMVNEGMQRGQLPIMISIAAVVQNRGIVNLSSKAGQQLMREYGDSQSELIASACIMNDVQNGTISRNYLREIGIFTSRLRQALKTEREMRKRLRVRKRAPTHSIDREEVGKAIIAGMPDQIYMRVGKPNHYIDTHDNVRYMYQGAPALGAKLVVGIPLDHHSTRHAESQHVEHSLILATAVEPEWVLEVDPDNTYIRVEEEADYNPDCDQVQIHKLYYFRNRLIKRSASESSSYKGDRSKTVADWLALRVLEDKQQGTLGEFSVLVKFNRDLISLVKDLNLRAGQQVFTVPEQKRLSQYFYQQLNGAACYSEIKQLAKLYLPQPDASKVKQIRAAWPDTIQLGGITAELVYSETEAPVALIKPSVVYTDRWRELPDGPAVLPNGTQCKIEAKLATGSVIQADGRRLKQVLIRVLDAIKSEKIAAEYEQKVWPIDVESDSLPDVEVQQLGLSADGSTQLELYLGLRVDCHGKPPFILGYPTKNRVKAEHAILATRRFVTLWQSNSFSALHGTARGETVEEQIMSVIPSWVANPQIESSAPNQIHLTSQNDQTYEYALEYICQKLRTRFKLSYISFKAKLDLFEIQRIVREECGLQRLLSATIEETPHGKHRIVLDVVGEEDQQLTTAGIQVEARTGAHVRYRDRREGLMTGWIVIDASDQATADDSKDFPSLSQMKGVVEELQAALPQTLEPKAIRASGLGFMIECGSTLVAFDLLHPKLVALSAQYQAPLILIREEPENKALKQTIDSMQHTLEEQGIRGANILLKKGKLRIQIPRDVSFEPELKRLSELLSEVTSLPFTVKIDRSKFRLERVAIEELRDLPYRDARANNMTKDIHIFLVAEKPTQQHERAARRIQNRTGTKVLFETNSPALDFQLQLAASSQTAEILYPELIAFVNDMRKALEPKIPDILEILIRGNRLILLHSNQDPDLAYMEQLLAPFAANSPLEIAVLYTEKRDPIWH